jgi:hypothetical protein
MTGACGVATPIRARRAGRRVSRSCHARLACACRVGGGALRHHCNASRPERGAAVAGRSVGSTSVTRAVASPTAPARVRTRHRRTPPHDQTSPDLHRAARRDRRVQLAGGHDEPERTVPGEPVGPGHEPVGRAELLLVSSQLRLAPARQRRPSAPPGVVLCVSRRRSPTRRCGAGGSGPPVPTPHRLSGCGSPPGRRRRPLQVPCRLPGSSP